MASLKNINSFRRKFTHSLTRSIGKTKSVQSIAPDQVRSVLVCRPNHRLGNLLLITPLLQELEENFPQAKIDIFLKGNLGPIVLQEYDSVDQIIALPKKHFKELPKYISTWFKIRKKKYDLVINAVPSSSSGRISTKISRAKYKIFGDQEIEKRSSTQNYRHIAKLPVCCLRNSLVTQKNKTDFPILNLKISEDEKQLGKNVLEKILGHSENVLAIFTYATGEKCYSKHWWKSFYGKLQENFPDYSILEILPKENVSQIDFAAPTYYSQDLREICGLLANISCFVGADSGMMHLAVAAKIPVMGLFSVTNPEKYKPYGPKNLAIETEKLSIQEILKQMKLVVFHPEKLSNP